MDAFKEKQMAKYKEYNSFKQGHHTEDTTEDTDKDANGEKPLIEA